MSNISSLFQAIGLTIIGAVGCVLCGGILFRTADEELGAFVWDRARRCIMDHNKYIKVVMVDDASNRILFTATDLNGTAVYTVLIKKEEK